MSLVEVIIRDERRRVWTLVVPLTGADRNPQNATLGLERSERQSGDRSAGGGRDNRTRQVGLPDRYFAGGDTKIVSTP